MEKDNVCRTCLQAFQINEVIRLNIAEDEADSITLRQKLEACVPELTVDIVHDPVVCQTCCAAIVLAYQFKSSCLENEKTLYRFIQQRKENAYDLITTSDLLKIVRTDINEEHSYSFLKKCESKRRFSDSENENESLKLKLPTTIQASFEGLVKQALAENSFNIDIEDKEEIPKGTSKTKGKNNKIKKSLTNGDTAEVVESATKSKEIVSADSNTKPICNVKNLSASTSLTDNNKQGISVTTRRSSTGQDSLSCVTTEVPENIKQINQQPPKRNQNNMKSTKSSKNIEQKENNVDIMKQNTSKIHSLTYDKITTAPKKKSLKKEQYSDSSTASTKTIQKHISSTPDELHDSKSNKIEFVSSPSITIKSNLSDRDIANDTIENDLLEINKIVLKADITESPKVNAYRKDTKGYCCNKCNKIYTYKSHFNVHVKSHIFKKMYRCPTCEKSFTQEKYLHSHKLLHTNSGLYQCDICLKYLSASTALKRHLRTHTGEKPFACSCCGKKFSQKIQMAVHMRTHTGFRPFTCDICSANFAQKSHLMGHLRIHTGEKPFKCAECPKCFRKSYALQIHKHSHSIKPFQCRACNVLFRDADTFQRHVNKHLLSMAKNQSRVSKKPKSKRKILDELEQDVQDINMGVDLLEQIEQKHKICLYTCNICSRGFTTRFSMKRHMKIHNKDIVE